MTPLDCRDVPAGRLVLGVAALGSLRWATVELAALLEGARCRADLSPLATVALGRTLSAAALLHRFTLKQPGQIVVEIAGDGPLGRAVAEIGPAGYLRGLVGSPQIESPSPGQLSLREVVGEGTFKVLRTTAGKRYDSQVRLTSGEIGEDLVHYLEQSEQIRSAAFVGELLGPEGVRAGGGMLVEALPGTTEETLRHLEENIDRLPGVPWELERGGLLDAVLAGLEPEELESHPLRYGCDGGRDRIADRLSTLSADDLDHLVDAGGRFTAECAYCGLGFTFSRDELLPPN